MDGRKLVRSIVDAYGYDEAYAGNYAGRIESNLSPELYPVLEAWINGEEIPIVKVGKYSVDIVMQIAETDDFLYALMLLNDYLMDPEKGEAAIWSPMRSLHISARRSENKDE